MFGWLNKKDDEFIDSAPDLEKFKIIRKKIQATLKRTRERNPVKLDRLLREVQAQHK